MQEEGLYQWYPLPEDDKEILKHRKKQLHYEKGENLIKQGAFASHILYIQTGLVRVFLQNRGQKQVNIRVAGSGSFLGFASLFGEDSYTCSAVAIKDCRVCMIDRDGLLSLLSRNSAFAMRLTAQNVQDESHLLKLISLLSHQQMRGKLAHALLYLSRDEFLREDIFFHLTRQDLAGFAAITAESAIRFLKEFEKSGILELSGKDIRIINRTQLKEIAQKG